MAIRYYPQSRLKTNLVTNGSQFRLNGSPYAGKYYQTFDGKYYSGANPIVGPNQQLEPVTVYANQLELDALRLNPNARKEFANKTKSQDSSVGVYEPASYFPTPTESDYRKGYFFRYFVKKINEKGYVKEISQQEFELIKLGTAPYDVSYYQIESVMWKLTGPLNTVRLSQYDIRAGIIDTNKRLVETVDTRFLGIKAFVGDEYSKFARPTSATQ